jgi:hypothetical protein
LVGFTCAVLVKKKLLQSSIKKEKLNLDKYCIEKFFKYEKHIIKSKAIEFNYPAAIPVFDEGNCTV